MFKNLRDRYVNPKEVVKNQTRFKLGLGEIKKGNRSHKLEEQLNLIQHIKDFFDLQEKIIELFRDYSFLLSEAKYRAKQDK